ncbi:MAG: DUF4280 domain-containing protein [Alphaproteobacteria bacterium]|nr:MAG: DUF4280 domain-containing protein [Alphaproteobacteria bacterium]
MGCVQMCTFGMAPMPFLPIPSNIFTVEPVGSMVDIIPFMNIMPFAMCVSLLNPMVLSATIAAFGILIPMPCIPIPVMPRTPAAYNILRDDALPVATVPSMTMCAWIGVITPIVPDQFEVIAV